MHLLINVLTNTIENIKYNKQPSAAMDKYTKLMVYTAGIMDNTSKNINNPTEV